MRLLVIALCGSLGMFALAHGAQIDSDAWLGVALILLGVGVAACIPRIRVSWTWVIIMRDLFRRWR